MHASCYHETDDSRISYFLKCFSPADILRCFASLGVESIEKYGYVYPKTEKAETVAAALLNACHQADFPVQFFYESGQQEISELRKSFDAVILSCGSAACKKTGSDGSGYLYLRKLGIPYTRILPALCPLKANADELLKDFPSKRFFGRVTVLIEGAARASETGEIQLRSNAVSGIPVMNVSREVSRALDTGKEVRLRLEPVTPEDLPENLRARLAAEFSSAGENSAEKTRSVFCEKTYELPVCEISRFDEAQVCTGGVPLESLTDTLEVKNHSGIYITGELCDVDGICGGYNLHWAWLSGMIAGKAAAE